MNKLRKNFTEEMYASKDGAKAPPDILENLQKIHLVLLLVQKLLLPYGEISILSGYRSPKRNRRVGGARKSQHLKGLAADIVVNSLTPRQVYDALKRFMSAGLIPPGGLGLYKTFVHMDIRGTNARWMGKRVKADG